MILTTENRKFIAESIDNAIKAKGFVELIDGYAANVLLSAIDSYTDKHLQVTDELKERLNKLVDAVKAQDFETVETLSTEIIDSLIDIPGIDDVSEALLFEGAIKLILGALQNWLKKG